MNSVQPGPDLLLGTCPECSTKTRLFTLWPGRLLCIECFRRLVSWIIKNREA